MERPCKRSRADDDAGTGTGSLAAAGVDRLSALPDCLLHEMIMSFLKARQAVQTCVLSTRWSHLWRSVPCIDADLDEFGAAAMAASSYSDRELCWERFQDFMDTLLSPGNISIARLDTFRLRVSVAASHYPITREGYRWIRRGIKYDGDAAGFSRRCCATRTWRLRKLHLDGVHQLDELFSEHVASGCPNLEDLELTDCRCEFRAITSGSLKNLVMKRCCLRGVGEIASPTMESLVIDDGCSNTHDCLLVVTAPAAASVFLGVADSAFGGGFSFREMPGHAKASVRLRSWNIAVTLKFLGTVSDVMTNLELSQQTMALGEWPATFPQFNNLRGLELIQCDLSDGFKMLGFFLRNAHNLERLTLLHCKYSNNDSKNKRRSSKSKNTGPTPCPNLIDARCENLKLTEIIYQEQEEDIRQRIELLLCISENLPNSFIKLIKK